MLFQTNKSVENIGARRLHTIIERVMEEISFNACDNKNDASEKEKVEVVNCNAVSGVGFTNNIEVTADYVRSKVGDMIINSDMRKYIL